MVIQTKTQISLALKDAQAMKPDASVQNAKDGKVSGLNRIDTMDCAVQQDLGSGTVYTEAEARQLNTEIMEIPDTGNMSPAEFIHRCMTGEDARELSEEGTPLEEYTSSQLERAVKRVKEQRAQRREAVEDQVARERQEREALEQNVIQNAIGVELSDALKRQLEQSDLPVTSDMVEHLTHSVELAQMRDQISQDTMKYFIGNQLKITPENIRAGVYGGAVSQPGFLPEGESSFASVEKQVEKILHADGMEVTDPVMQTARWLYDNELPVTADNIRTYEQLEQIRDAGMDTLVERIVDHIAEGIEPKKADLTTMSMREAQDTVDELLAADDQKIRSIYPSEVDFITAKRQMEEIRLMMTASAARSMAARGIDLNLSNLEQIVMELREQEQQAKQMWLEEAGVPVTEQNITVFSDTTSAAHNVLSAPVELLANTIESASTQTLTELSDSASVLKAQYDKMERTYEAVGTEVRTDLGDSIKKAFGNIDEILDELGLEKTAMNQRAVRILGYNQMEVSAENIENMKAYDDKVTTLMKNMRPPVVAELIHRDINPLSMTLDELSEAVHTIQSELPTQDVSLRKFLWKMDRQNNLSEQERSSMIGVYRLLDKIEKSDGAVIGQVIKEGRELSLSSLLSATRTRRAEGLDVEIDDSFGGLEKIVTKGESIDAQIQTAYQSSVANQLQRELLPSVLRELGEDVWDFSMESLLDRMRNAAEEQDGMEDYFSELAQEISETMATATDDLDREFVSFLSAMDLPDTVANRMMVQSFASGRLQEYLSLWKREESEKLQEILDDPDQLEEFYEKIDETHKTEIENQREDDDISYGDVVSLARMAGGISFYKTLRSHQTYEVPILTEQGITSCNVTIRGGGQNKGTVEISVDSERLGKIRATFKVSDKNVRGFVTAQRTDSMGECQRILNGFEKDLEENGFTMESDHLVQGNRSFLHEINETPKGTKNQDLYLIAKCFIVNVGKDDEE